MTILRASGPACSLPFLPRPAPGAHAARQPCTGSHARRAPPGAGADRKRVRSSARLDELAAAADELERAGAEHAELQVEDADDAFPWLSSLGIALLPLLAAGPALAYDRAGGEEVLKNVAGAAYALLVCIFFVRLFRRRAKSGTSQSLRSSATPAAAGAAQRKPSELKAATPLTALWGAVQAGVIAWLLFQACGYIDAFFARQEMPDQYTARNITVTIRTIVRGLAYLVTFLFGANALGLAGLSIQLALYPDSLSEAAQKSQPPKEGSAADEPKLPNGPTA